MSDMEEVRRLQEALRQVQKASAPQRLSERNCVEIVSKLKQLGLVKNLITTLDGKEYVTPSRLDREILDELYLNKGRISHSELQIALSVDTAPLDAAIARALAGRSGDIHHVKSELITRCVIRGI